jgi:hypothetical protein
LTNKLKLEIKMKTFILWLILLFLCWPLAIVAIIVYPFIWLILLPFRILGFTFSFLFKFLEDLILLPFRILKRPSRVR